MAWRTQSHRHRLAAHRDGHASPPALDRTPDAQDKLKTLGLDPVLSMPEELAKYQASEIAKWAKVVKESGAKAE